MNDNQAIFEAYLEGTEQPGGWIDEIGVQRPWSNHDSQNPTLKKFGNVTRWVRQNGEFHREDGPVGAYWNGVEFYALNGSVYNSAEKWAQDVLISQKRPYNRAAIAAFLQPILAKQTKDFI